MLRRLACLLTLLSGLAGCSAPPENERQQAEAALSAARQADAATYAPAELQAAEASLAKYADAVAQRDYRQALSDALDARDRAYAAAKQAENRKAALRQQADHALADLDTLTKAASARLSGSAGPRPTGNAAERLRSALRSGVRVLQEARSRIDKQDYQGVIDDATTAAAALRRELPQTTPSRKR